VSLPINFMGREFAEAELRIVEPPGHKPIPLHFNPAEYKRKQENAFAEIPIPGLETPPLQYVRGNSEVLSMDLLVDTSGELESVYDKYVKGIEGLLKKDGKLHAPPIVEFVWGEQVFRGVMQSLEVTYVLFHTDGKPLRAKLAVQLKEHRPVKVQLGDPHETSPDVEKLWVVGPNQTLSSISAAVFRDPARWREIAVANAIADPRTIAPGTVLTIPRLEEPIA